MGQSIGTSTLRDNGLSQKANNCGTYTGISSTPSYDTLHPISSGKLQLHCHFLTLGAMSLLFIAKLVLSIYTHDKAFA
jgi:hypothetical protein